MRLSGEHVELSEIRSARRVDLGQAGLHLVGGDATEPQMPDHETRLSSTDVPPSPEARGVVPLLLAGAQRLMRDALSAAVETQLPQARVDVVRSFEHALEHVLRRPTTRAAIIDWDLPDLMSIESLARLSCALRGGRLIVLSSDLEDDMAEPLQRSGVHAAFSTDIGVADLSERILSVLAGESCFDLPSATHAMTAFQERHGLSNREARVFRHYLRGASAGEIADRLRVAETTVRAHLVRVHAKIGIREGIEAYPVLKRTLRWRPLDSDVMAAEAVA
jgi:DNA-binding NarL/FixJ family response regulator